MEENGLVKTYMNIENLSFYDKASDKHIKRTIVYLKILFINTF